MTFKMRSTEGDLSLDPSTCRELGVMMQVQYTSITFSPTHGKSALILARLRWYEVVKHDFHEGCSKRLRSQYSRIRLHCECVVELLT